MLSSRGPQYTISKDVQENEAEQKIPNVGSFSLTKGKVQLLLRKFPEKI